MKTSHSLAGPENTFMDIYKGRSTKVQVDLTNGIVIGDVHCKADIDSKYTMLTRRVQFRVGAINIVGHSVWSSPTAIRLPEGIFAR